VQYRSAVVCDLPSISSKNSIFHHALAVVFGANIIIAMYICELDVCETTIFYASMGQTWLKSVHCILKLSLILAIKGQGDPLIVKP